ncbi:lipoprotein [Bifidobacterium dolichotidis]|uniref:Lipoprotein n=2 Tax=Bifidobacterium dolichotidis TaxID=2306976 RepID=A0A430FQ55_9BIFI|nr:lipoprotein [Bifidobacterium dolichotidis]
MIAKFSKFKKGLALTVSALLATTAFATGSANANSSAADNQAQQTSENAKSTTGPLGVIKSSGVWGKDSNPTVNDEDRCSWKLDRVTGQMVLAPDHECILTPSDGLFLDQNDTQRATRHAIRSMRVEHTVHVGYSKQLSGMFRDASNFKNLTGMDKFDFSKVTSQVTEIDLSEMFAGTNYQFADFENLNVGDRTLNISGMFSNSSSRNIDITNMPFDKVTKATGLFQDMEYLKKAEIPPLQANKLTDMAFMFAGDVEMNSVDWRMKTPNAKTMESMFDGCKELDHLNLSKMKAENIAVTKRAFADCSKLQVVDLGDMTLSGIDTGVKGSTVADNMFLNSPVRELNLTTSAVKSLNQATFYSTEAAPDFPATTRTMWRAYNPVTSKYMTLLWWTWSNFTTEDPHEEITLELADNVDLETTAQ